MSSACRLSACCKWGLCLSTLYTSVAESGSVRQRCGAWVLTFCPVHRTRSSRDEQATSQINRHSLFFPLSPSLPLAPSLPPSPPLPHPHYPLSSTRPLSLPLTHAISITLPLLPPFLSPTSIPPPFLPPPHIPNLPHSSPHPLSLPLPQHQSPSPISLPPPPPPFRSPHYIPPSRYPPPPHSNIAKNTFFQCLNTTKSHTIH